MDDWEVKTERIYACSDEEYDRQMNGYCEGGWEPYSSQYTQDNWYVVRLKRKKVSLDDWRNSIAEDL